MVLLTRYTSAKMLPPTCVPPYILDMVRKEVLITGTVKVDVCINVVPLMEDPIRLENCT
jgi:hypothetical protein